MPDSVWDHLHDDRFDDEGDELADRELPHLADVDRLMGVPDEYEPAIDTRWDEEAEEREAKGKQ
jgi:hypothetical protein